MTVRELLERIDSAELTEWQAFFALLQEAGADEPAEPAGFDFKAQYQAHLRKVRNG